MQLRSTRLTAYGRGRTAWTPAQISTALWLDAADSSTVTLNGSTVSQWNDKSGNGRNAVQATAANQPGWGVGRNLLLWSEAFDNAAWTKQGVSITQNSASAPNGTLTADKLTATTTGICQCGQTFITVSTGGTVCFTARLKQAEKRFAYLQINGLGSTLNAGFVSIDLQTGQAGTYANLVGALVSPVVTVLQERDGYWALSLSAGVGAGNNQASVYVGLTDSQNSRDVTVASGGIFAWGAQLNPGTTADAYQKTDGAASPTTTGINSKPALTFDGINDLLKTTLSVGISGANPRTLLYVYFDPGTSRGPMIQMGSSNALQAFGRDISAGGFLYHWSSDLPMVPPSAGTSNIEVLQSTGAVSTGFLNGTQTAQGNFALNTTNNPILIGGRNSPEFSFAGYAAVNFGEIILTASVLSTTDRQRLEGYLAWKWGGF